MRQNFLRRVRIRFALVKAALAFVTIGFCVLLYVASPAWGNGRFPKAQVVATRGATSDAERAEEDAVYLRATFGLLLSKDGGKSFQWLCEQALGFEGNFDPPIAVTKDGRLFVGLADGLRVTKDGCEVHDVPELRGEFISDLTVDAARRRAFAVTSTPEKRAYVFREEPSGKWTRLGAGVEGFVFDTIEVGGPRASRVYLTGYPTRPGKKAHLFRSDDGGATIAEVNSRLARDGRLFISAVDAKHPDRILVRQLHDDGSDVLLSSDAGKTLVPVLHTKGAMLGFAASDDWQWVFAGSGDPKEGIYRSRDGGRTWEPAAKVGSHCLAADGPRLFVCSNPFAPSGFALGVSHDHATSVEALATFDGIRGAIECDGGPAETCGPRWREVQAVVAATASAMAAPPPSEDAPTAPEPRGLPEKTASPATRERRASCGCEFVSGGRETPAIAFFVIAAVAVGRLRRRRAPMDPKRPTGDSLSAQRRGRLARQRGRESRAR